MRRVSLVENCVCIGNTTAWNSAIFDHQAPSPECGSDGATRQDRRASHCKCSRCSEGVACNSNESGRGWSQEPRTKAKNKNKRRASFENRILTAAAHASTKVADYLGTSSIDVSRGCRNPAFSQPSCWASGDITKNRTAKNRIVPQFVTFLLLTHRYRYQPPAAGRTLFPQRPRAHNAPTTATAPVCRTPPDEPEEKLVKLPCTRSRGKKSCTDQQKAH